MRKKLSALPPRLPGKAARLILATNSFPLSRRKSPAATPPRFPGQTTLLSLPTSSLPLLRRHRLDGRTRAVFSKVSKGMGLVFTGIEREQSGPLEEWVGEARETSWLAANRRRSQRVLMPIPVRVSGQTGPGSLFEEETHTLAISAHGALIAVSKQVNKGQRLSLSNVQTRAALECVVAHIGKREGERIQVR